MESSNTNRTHRFTIRFNDTEHSKLITMFKKSGCKTFNNFFRNLVFGKEFIVITRDQTKRDYIAKLNYLNSQFNAIGKNYNQVVKIVNSLSDPKEIIPHMDKLQKYTKLLVGVEHTIQKLTEEIKEKWS